MKAAFIISALGSWGVMLFFPWWTMVIPCFIGGLIGPDRGYKAFFSGFLGVGVLWLILSLIADWQNGWVMSPQIADLMKLPSTWYLHLITISIGSVVAGMSCLTGYLLLGRTR